jgi:hypothetical protein
MVSWHIIFKDKTAAVPECQVVRETKIMAFKWVVLFLVTTCFLVTTIDSCGGLDPPNERWRSSRKVLSDIRVFGRGSCAFC